MDHDHDMTISGQTPEKERWVLVSQSDLPVHHAYRLHPVCCVTFHSWCFPQKRPQESSSIRRILCQTDYWHLGFPFYNLRRGFLKHPWSNDNMSYQQKWFRSNDIETESDSLSKQEGWNRRKIANALTIVVLRFWYCLTVFSSHISIFFFIDICVENFSDFWKMSLTLAVCQELWCLCICVLIPGMLLEPLIEVPTVYMYVCVYASHSCQFVVIHCAFSP